jgi:hypothetical protein
MYTVTGNTPWPSWELYGYYTGADWPVMRMFATKPPGSSINNPEVPMMSDNDKRTAFPPQEFGFGSAHPGIICAVFGDGSTRTISRSADLIVLDQLGKRSDQTSPSLDSL